ncbi:40S ribosomal protein S3-3 [Linum grandiflorum]
MESGAKGCDFIVSGKLRAQRAKSMKFKDGYMISSGHPVNEYINFAVRHVLLRQGVLGIKVKVMLDWDSKGKLGPTTPLPDLVTTTKGRGRVHEGYHRHECSGLCCRYRDSCSYHYCSLRATVFLNVSF